MATPDPWSFYQRSFHQKKYEGRCIKSNEYSAVTIGGVIKYSPAYKAFQEKEKNYTGYRVVKIGQTTIRTLNDIYKVLESKYNKATIKLYLSKGDSTQLHVIFFLKMNFPSTEFHNRGCLL